MAIINRWFEQHLQPAQAQRWRRWPVGAGRFVIHASGLRLVVPRTSNAHYSNAQIDDYVGLPRNAYPWQPPLRLTVRARFSSTLHGTAGFGFWNHPFAPNTGIGALPRAIWFFYGSPPTDLPLALDVPGFGWKTATIDTLRPQAIRWTPLAPLVVLLNQSIRLRRRIWPLVQRDLQIAEARIDAAMDEWHDYQLEWRADGARFSVDARIVLDTNCAPRGPLGFVAWVDNQYAVATPWGRLGWGLLDVPQAQWLDLAQIRIEPL